MGVPPRPSLTKTPHKWLITGARIKSIYRVDPVQVIPDVTDTKQHTEHEIVSSTKQQVNKAMKE